MTDLLKQLGVTKEELLDRAVKSIVSEVLDADSAIDDLEASVFDECRAQVRVAIDAQVARLMGELAQKYPDEFPSWKGRMEAGHKDGSRILLRYTPVSG